MVKKNDEKTFWHPPVWLERWGYRNQWDQICSINLRANHHRWISFFPDENHWADLRLSIIVSCLDSVSAFPFDQTIFLFPPSIHATSIFPVSPWAEWVLISWLGNAAWRDFFNRRAGPPYPHPPQYSMSITFTILNKYIIKFRTYILFKNIAHINYNNYKYQFDCFSDFDG